MIKNLTNLLTVSFIIVLTTFLVGFVEFSIKSVPMLPSDSCHQTSWSWGAGWTEKVPSRSQEMLTAWAGAPSSSTTSQKSSPSSMITKPKHPAMGRDWVPHRSAERCVSQKVRSFQNMLGSSLRGPKVMQINLLIAVVCLNMAKIQDLAGFGGFGGQPANWHIATPLSGHNR